MLNKYKDILTPTTGMHGGSISEQRVDDLDTACIDFVKSRIASHNKCKAVDIGGHNGSQSKRMAELGADVLLVEITDQEDQIADFNKKLGRNAILSLRGDAATVKWPDSLDCIYSQRMIHYLPYGPARQMLQRLHKASSKEAQFFISSSGMETELAVDYPHRHRAVTDRFSHLSPVMAEKHDIRSAVCLYSETELNDLARAAGLKVLRSWTSPFGNPKLIAEPC